MVTFEVKGVGYVEILAENGEKALEIFENGEVNSERIIDEDISNIHCKEA